MVIGQELPLAGARFEAFHGSRVLAPAIDPRSACAEHRRGHAGVSH